MTCYHCGAKDNSTFYTEILSSDGKRMRLYLCKRCHNYIEDFPDDHVHDAERQRQREIREAESQRRREIERKQAIQKELDDESLRRYIARQEDKRWEKEYNDELKRW